jgi:hypothetical protein
MSKSRGHPRNEKTRAPQTEKYIGHDELSRTLTVIVRLQLIEAIAELSLLEQI